MNYGHHFALLAQYAYYEPDHAVVAYSDLGYDNVTFITKRNTQCYIMESKDKVVIAVRGTEVSCTDDIFSDLKFITRKSNTKGGVHVGFFDDANEIWSAINDYIANPSRSSKKLWICGHSLGGAIACILASRLPFKTAACYTYGCPRVGNKRWAKSQRTVHHRYVNNNDIVPRIPPVWLWFRHYGELIYINYYGHVRKLTPWQRTKDRIRGIIRAWQKGEPFDTFRDHGIEYYVKYLRDQ